MKSLGADEVVDYTRQDFSRAGRVYDIVFDTVGKRGFSRSLKSLKRGGFYVRVGGSGRLLSILAAILQEKWASITGAAKVIGGMSDGVTGDLSFIKGLIEAGKLRTVIDRRYSLDEIAEAHRYVEAGHKKGHVVIVMNRRTDRLPVQPHEDFHQKYRSTTRGGPELPLITVVAITT